MGITCVNISGTDEPESSKAPALRAGITSVLPHGLSVSEPGGQVGVLTESFCLGESWRETQSASHLCVLARQLSPCRDSNSLLLQARRAHPWQGRAVGEAFVEHSITL